MWQLMCDDRTTEDVIVTLSNEYDVEEHRVRPDLDTVTGQQQNEAIYGQEKEKTKWNQDS